jgi:hypothetical protein
MQNHTLFGAVEAIHRADRHARRIRAMHAGHRNGTLTRNAIVDRDHPAAVHAPGYFMFLLACRHAAIAFDATLGITEKFHSSHRFLLTP